MFCNFVNSFLSISMVVFSEINIHNIVVNKTRVFEVRMYCDVIDHTYTGNGYYTNRCCMIFIVMALRNDWQ